MSYFATLNHPNGGVVPLTDEGGENVATFERFDEAAQAVASNTLGHAYGGRVYNTEEEGTDV